MVNTRLAIPKTKIAAFCRRWKVVEMGLFGSILREDFDERSDVDVLVTFASETQVSLFDLAQMQIELEALLGRPVDLVEKDALRNPFRKREILKTARVIYASG